MSLNKNKINIDSLSEQLESIVEEYNNIDFDIKLNQPSVVCLENKLSSLNQENQFLEKEIKLLKKYISHKIELLNNENRFESIFNKFLEYFNSGKYSKKELMKKFSQYVEKEFSGELINTIDFNNIQNFNSNGKLSINKIEWAFENALDQIRKIQSSKNSFINEIISTRGLSYSSTDEILHSVFEYLDGIENKLFYQIQETFNEQKDILADLYQLENFNILKNNVLNVISDNINNLKNEFINFVSFNKYLDKKIDNFRHTAPEFSDVLDQTFKLESNSKEKDEKFESLEAKVNTLINVINNLKNNDNTENFDQLIKTTTNNVVDEKFLVLENKLTKLIKDIDEKNNKILENQNTSKNDVDVEKIIDTIKTSITEENKNFISKIIENNLNEKKDILSLLRTIQKQSEEKNNEYEVKFKQDKNSQKLLELEHLISIQNNEIESLLADKEEVLETIEKLIHENKREILNETTLEHVRDSILDIAQTFEVRINNLEESVNKEFEKLNIKSLGEQLDTNRENINTSINNLENKLITNYEQIKDNINESFESILSSINNNGKDNNSLFELTNLIDRKFDKLEYLYKDIDSKNELFKNEIVEKIQDFVNRSSDSNALNEGLDRIEKMLNTSLINIQEGAENSYEKIDTKISKIDNTTDSIVNELKQHQTVFDNLSSKLLNNFDKYEELLIKSLDKDKRNYEELKLIISEHFYKKEQELNEAERAKLESLNKKLDNLVDLINLQEQEINSLIEEKDEVIKQINSNLKDNDFTRDEIESISSIIEEKINLCLKRILESPDNISNFFLSNNHQNEFAQVNDKIDELSKYVYDNIEIHKNGSSFKDFVRIESYKDTHNLDFVFDKLTNIQKDLLNILKIDINSLDKDGIVKIQKDITTFKFNLLNIENDVIVLKTKINNNLISENYVNEEDFREIVEINNRKISMIEELIEKNNTILSNLSIEKEKIISKTEKDLSANFDINDNDNLEIILEAKANTVIDRMIGEIKENQNQEILEIENSFQELENKIDTKTINNVQIDDDLKKKIDSIEEMISNSYKSLAKINEDLISYLDDRLSENSDSFNKIVKKFEEERQEIKNEIIAQSNALKNQLSLLNNDEIELYKSELQSYTKQLKKAQSRIFELEAKFQNSNDTALEKDRIIVGQEFRLEHIGELIDNLSLQIDSFIEEKNELINLMSNKLDYLGKLQAPEKGEFIELESDNLETNKFQKIIFDETSNMIQEKFKELRNNFEDYANEIRLTFDVINREQNELTTNQIINKKENDENISTIEKRLKDIEKIIFKNKSKNSNIVDDNLELQKINKYDNNTLELINDNILFYVDELERRKNEIEIFYKKIRNLKKNLNKQSN